MRHYYSFSTWKTLAGENLDLWDPDIFAGSGGKGKCSKAPPSVCGEAIPLIHWPTEPRLSGARYPRTKIRPFSEFILFFSFG